MFLAMIEAKGAGWWARAQPYLDYPGFEVWKFFNLAIFVFALVFILTRKAKLGEVFKARRETIKQELARAQQERDGQRQSTIDLLGGFVLMTASGSSPVSPSSAT
jgi:hypothetical protein